MGIQVKHPHLDNPVVNCVAGVRLSHLWGGGRGKSPSLQASKCYYIYPLRDIETRDSETRDIATRDSETRDIATRNTETGEAGESEVSDAREVVTPFAFTTEQLEVIRAIEGP